MAFLHLFRKCFKNN